MHVQARIKWIALLGFRCGPKHDCEAVDCKMKGSDPLIFHNHWQFFPRYAEKQ